MKKFSPLVLFLMFILPEYTLAKDDLSYVDGSKPFIQIKDINRQAEAWGTCSAAYEVMSILLKSTPAQAKQIKDYSNGATIAVVMTHVTSALTSDMTPEKFNAIWDYSKTLGDSIPETKRTMILASAESLGETNANKFADKITATVKVCNSNLVDQQMYIDAWRNLAKSGLLKIPKN